MTRLTLPPEVTGPGVIAVLRAPDARDYERVCRALVDAGVTAIELTLTTPGTIATLPSLRNALPRAAFGIGTVTDTDRARAAIDAGAAFLVTPVVRTEVVEAAVHDGIPVVCGAMTPTEVLAGWDAGAAAVKLFPAATLGPEYTAQLAGPFPGVVTVPSGGIGLDEIAAWIRGGAAAVSLGGPLVGDAFRAEDLAPLLNRAHLALDSVRAARS